MNFDFMKIPAGLQRHAFVLALEDPVTLRVNVCIVMWLGTGGGRTMMGLAAIAP